MALLSISNIKISGISACVPHKMVSNLDYEWVEPKERQLMIKTIGVMNRRIAGNNDTTSDLCDAAASKLLDDMRWKRKDVEALVFVTQSPDYLIPGNGTILQDRLGLAKSCLAFDINLGCSGYVYGLAVLAGLMSSGKIKKGLLLTGDVSSKGISEKDKSACPLFSDAGSATALEYCRKDDAMYFNLMSDGNGYDALYIPDGGLKSPFSEKTLKYEEIEKGIIRNRRQIALNGLDILNFTLREVAPNIEKLLTYCGKPVTDFHYVVFHQANLYMNECVRKKLKLPAEKVPYSLSKFGNTSSASIPLTLVTELGQKVMKKNLSMIFSGFGVGLSWGSVALSTREIICPELIEKD